MAPRRCVVAGRCAAAVAARSRRRQQAGLKAAEADSGAVTLIQHFGSAANLNIHLHCPVLDGVYRRTESEPVFVEVPVPTDAVL